MTGNKKSFILTNISSKSFNIILSSFDFVVTFLFRIKNKIKIVAISSAIQKISQTISVKKIKIVISQMKLIAKITQTFNIKKVKFSFISKAILSSFSIINIKNTISFISKLTQKANTTVILKRIKITVVPLFAQFFTLGTYDVQTLGAMDIVTLGNLDYILIP